MLFLGASSPHRLHSGVLSLANSSMRFTSPSCWYTTYTELNFHWRWFLWEDAWVCKSRWCYSDCLLRRLMLCFCSAKRVARIKSYFFITSYYKKILLVQGKVCNLFIYFLDEPHIQNLHSIHHHHNLGHFLFLLAWREWKLLAQKIYLFHQLQL